MPYGAEQESYEIHVGMNVKRWNELWTIGPFK